MKIYLNAKENDGPTWTKKDYLLAAADRLGLGEVVVDYSKKVDKKIPPENILNIEPFGKFVEGTNWTGVWEIDLIIDRAETSPSNWVRCDNVLLANSAYHKRLEPYMDNAMIFFQAADPEIHKPLPGVEKEADFVFSGSTGHKMYDERKRTMNLLMKRSSFKSFGKNHSLPDYVEYLNRGRIQFIRSAKNEVSDGHLAQRFFECMAIGPVLVDYHEDLELTGYVEGKDYFSYEEDVEMIVKMQILLDDPERAHKMARGGREKTLAMHTYDHRLISIINLVKEVNGSRFND